MARSRQSQTEEQQQQAQTEEQQQAQPANQQSTEKEPEAFKVLIRRVGDDPITCVSVESGGGMKQWHPSPTETSFEVDVATAHAAVATGGFEVDPKSKTKLK